MFKKCVAYTEVRTCHLWLQSPFVLPTGPYKITIMQKLGGNPIFRKVFRAFFTNNSSICKGGYHELLFILFGSTSFERYGAFHRIKKFKK